MRTICFAVIALSTVCVPAFSQQSENKVEVFMEHYQRYHASLLVCFAENAPLLDDGETSITLIARALRTKCTDILILCALKYPADNAPSDVSDRLDWWAAINRKRDECEESDFVDESLVAVLEARVRNQ